MHPGDIKQLAQICTDQAKWSADNTRRGFYREFKKVVSQADVVIEVLDARDPLACRCVDIERYIRSVDVNKKIILVLNKVGACLMMYVRTIASKQG